MRNKWLWRMALTTLLITICGLQKAVVLHADVAPANKFKNQCWFSVWERVWWRLHKTYCQSYCCLSNTTASSNTFTIITPTHSAQQNTAPPRTQLDRLQFGTCCHVKTIRTNGWYTRGRGCTARSPIPGLCFSWGLLKQNETNIQYEIATIRDEYSIRNCYNKGWIFNRKLLQ